MAKQAKRLGLLGLSLGEKFVVKESAGVIHRGNVLSMLKGAVEQSCAVYVARNAISRRICNQLHRNFWNAVVAKGNNRDDHVGAAQIGANQYERSTEEYFSQVSSSQKSVESLFSGFGKEEREAVLRDDWLRANLSAENVSFRAASYLGAQVNPCTARSWRNPGEFSLLAHEDRAQLALAQKDSFEIAQVSHVVTYNACISSGEGGELVVWDIDPDEQSKHALGVQSSGYHYPLELLSEYPSMEISIRAGDIYFLSSNLVYAVRAVSGEPRVTIGRFMGYVDQETVVYWT